ncbi:hypothetical protein ACFVU3_14500 [Streptomyces sp. NPDC058052]|uniref:hypothetical protein n=1 Tax=Streptomyces sp. NPDC058052 TaxID=3346316 RepID=UPI0036E508C1
MSDRVGAARLGLDDRDITAQCEIPIGLDVRDERICLDHGATGTGRERPGLDRSRAAGRAGEGISMARAKDALKGKRPRLTARRQTHLVQRHRSGGE